jgi:hypothetical protein
MKLEGSGHTSEIVRPATTREQELIFIEQQCENILHILTVLKLPPKFKLIVGQNYRTGESKVNILTRNRPDNSYETLREGIMTREELISGLRNGLQETDLLKRESFKLRTDDGDLVPFAYGTELYIEPPIDDLIEAVSSNGEDGVVSLDDCRERIESFKRSRALKVQSGVPSDTTRH